MPTIQIDLSGKNGLAPNNFAAFSSDTAQPNLVYEAKEGQMAGGIYNPFRLPGYLNPANNTFDAVSTYLPITLTTTIGSSQNWQYAGIAINPSSTTAPTILGTPTSGTTASGTTLTISTTVDIGTDKILTVLAMNPTGAAATSATFNGVAMTLVATGVSSAFWTIFQLVSPAVTTANVVITWSVSSGNLAAICVVTKDTNQTTPSAGTGSNDGTSTSATLSITPTANNTLLLGFVFSLNATHVQDGSQTELFNFQSAAPYRYSASRKSGTNLTNIIRSTVYNYAEADSYFAENGTRLWLLDSFDDTSATVIRTVTGAVFTDLEIYTVNGVKKLFYAYNKAGGGNIGMVDLPSTTFNDTWLSGTATGGTTLSAAGDIFMVPADNGFMYVFDTNAIHKIDGTTTGGTNGTFSANQIVFPAYFVFTDALDYRGNLWVSVQSETNLGSANTASSHPIVCGVYIWDRISAQVKMRDFIPVKGIREIRKIYLGSDNTIKLICITLERKIVIKKFNGTSFETVHELGILAYPTYRDSVTNYPDYIVWLGADGIIYANGVAPTSSTDSLFRIGNLGVSTAGATQIVGALLAQYANSSVTSLKNSAGIFVSLLSSSISYIKRWVIHGIDSSPIGSTPLIKHAGSIYTPVSLVPPMSTVKKIIIYMAPSTTTGTTTAATISVYFNQSTTAWANKVVTYNDCVKGYIEIEVNKSYINSVQLKTTYPETQITTATMFSPYLAVVDYQPTSTLK